MQQFCLQPREILVCSFLISGKPLQTKTGSETDGTCKVDLNISTYPQGLYFITIKDGKETRVVKLTKE